MHSAQEIITFWFTPPMSQRWFSSTPEIDQRIRDQFEELWQQAAKGELNHWRESAEGCLALAIILDQFPLNMFRGKPKGFATEQQAIEVSRHAIERGFDHELPKHTLGFLYMPLMHSESMEDQDLSVKKFAEAGLEHNLRFAKHHRGLIERFGRFPHRNAILGRESSPDELAYLSSKEAFTG